MSAFPGPGAQIYRNEAGEPLGWDYPSEPDYNDHDDDDRDVQTPCPGQCGTRFWGDDEDEIIAHHKVCNGPVEWSLADFDIKES